MVVLGVIGLIALAVLYFVIVLWISALLFSTSVPILIEDPSNFWAWVSVLVAVIMVVSLATFRTKDSK